MSATTMQRPTSISFRSPRTSTVDNMSMTQTYFLAHKARAKLSREAAQPDHDLRFLVGHANLLDTLMIELAEVERAQEQWFNQSVRGASASQKQERHVQWSEKNLAQVPEEEYNSEEESSEEEFEEDDLEEDYEQLSLVRTHSHSNSPPELVEESDSEDEEPMPRSPPQAIAQLSTAEKDEEQSEEEESLYEESYYLQKDATSPAVTAITVY